MELIVIAVAGTFALIAAEFRDFARRNRRNTVTQPSAAAARTRVSPTISDQSASSSDERYDIAA